jgi:hypothetical protein
MAKRSSNHKPGSDEEATSPSPEEEAASASAAAPDESGKNPAAVQLGRLGGKKGGPARARKLTQERRTEIARKAAQTRWANRRPQ